MINRNNAPIIAGLVLIGIILTVNSRENSHPAFTRAQVTPWDIHFNNAEKMYNLPDGLLMAIAKRESNFNPDARGKAGEIGLMQIIPKWHPGVNPYDPVESIYYAGQYIRKNLNRFGTIEGALTAYNWGPTNLSNYGINRAPASTKRYVSDILALINKGFR